MTERVSEEAALTALSALIEAVSGQSELAKQLVPGEDPAGPHAMGILQQIRALQEKARVAGEVLDAAGWTDPV